MSRDKRGSGCVAPWRGQGCKCPAILRSGGGEIVGDEPAADAGFPAGNEASAAIGARLGQYRLERRLGGGGVAVVYLARDERLDRGCRKIRK